MENKDIYCNCPEPDIHIEDSIPRCHKCLGIIPQSKTNKPTKVKIIKEKTKKEIKPIKTQQRSLL